MVISEIRSLYRDENDLFRTVIKRIYEQWNAQLQQWDLRRIEFIFEDPELPVRSDNPAVAVEQRHGWLIRRRGSLYRRFGRTSGSRCRKPCMTMRARSGFSDENQQTDFAM